MFINKKQIILLKYCKHYKTRFAISRLQLLLTLNIGLCLGPPRAAFDYWQNNCKWTEIGSQPPDAIATRPKFPHRMVVIRLSFKADLIGWCESRATREMRFTNDWRIFVKWIVHQKDLLFCVQQSNTQTPRRTIRLGLLTSRRRLLCTFLWQQGIDTYVTHTKTSS